ncbi:MAG TPA: acetyltransferase [Tepidisphaeraceae bacterium]|jgi:sugar O-acyltransferase (sialic acid O-acetyltransferase NeuD family)
MQIVIIGAGGHGKVVLDILRAAGEEEPVGFVDSSPSRAGGRIGGLPIFGPANVLPKLRQQGVRGAIVAIGDCRARVQYAAVLREQGFELVNAIHPTSSVSPTAVLGWNVVIAAQAAVCTDARIEDSVILNTACVVDHESEIGAGVHVCPGAHLAGRVRVGAGAWIGIGANVIQCLSIGEHAMVGAGAVVIRDVPAHSTVVGVPARVIKSAAPPDEGFASQIAAAESK